MPNPTFSSSTAFPAFLSWRSANAEATAFEIALLDASLRASDGSCAPPSAEEWRRSKVARAQVAALFREAMTEVDGVNEHATRIAELDDARLGVRLARAHESQSLELVGHGCHGELPTQCRRSAAGL
jgi:hypothetical protein